MGCYKISGRQAAKGRVAERLLGIIFAGLPFLIVLVANPTLGWAEVMEVGPDGSLTSYKEPGVYRDSGFTPLVAAQAPRTGRRYVARPPYGLTQTLLSSAALYYGLDLGLVNRLAWRESGYRQTAVSPKGAVGVMQLMKDTARDLGVDRNELAQNIFGGAAYFRQMLDRYGGDGALALAAYNAGPGTVDRLGVPVYRETRAYLRAILGEPDRSHGLVIFQADQ